MGLYTQLRSNGSFPFDFDWGCLRLTVDGTFLYSSLVYSNLVYSDTGLIPGNKRP